MMNQTLPIYQQALTRTMNIDSQQSAMMWQKWNWDVG